MRRLELIRSFYAILDSLGRNVGEALALSACSGRQPWPKRGVYFFFEPGEMRSDSGTGPRVVRIGTHALAAGSRTTLWNRLSQHAGSRKSGAGNHRGSIFRLLVGEAMKRRDGYDEPASWGIGADAGAAAARFNRSREQVKAAEQPLEQAVSRHISAMPFLWLAVEDDSGPSSARGIIERNSIALLSNYDRSPIDPPSEKWLGKYSGRNRVRLSGLWNNNHVDETCAEGFLQRMTEAVDRTARLR